MAEYKVEFTTTITVEANSEEKAVEEATEIMAEQGVDTSDFYIYVNGKGYN